MSTTTYCSHGDIQRAKLGVTTDAHGIDTCRGCGLPTWDSTAKAKTSPSSARTPSSPAPSQPVDYAKRAADDVHHIRVMVSIVAAIIAVVFFWLAFRPTAEPEVCLYYTDGSSTC